MYSHSTYTNFPRAAGKACTKQLDSTTPMKKMLVNYVPVSHTDQFLFKNTVTHPQSVSYKRSEIVFKTPSVTVSVNRKTMLADASQRNIGNSQLYDLKQLSVLKLFTLGTQ